MLLIYQHNKQLNTLVTGLQVDFIAVSFVKTPDIVVNLKSYIQSKLEKFGSNHAIDVYAKLESYDSVPNMSAIISASDGIMVARGDLGAQIPFEDVPAVQKEIVFRCRQVRTLSLPVLLILLADAKKYVREP